MRTAVHHHTRDFAIGFFVGATLVALMIAGM